ncbi:MAG: hypothetical protein KAH07_09875 [Flavobacteriaceae bacterium]|nr:hypothetical protein [Flavobacteriaceae bacterium]
MKDLTPELMLGNTTKNTKIFNPENNSLIFGRVPNNPKGIPEGLIYLRLGFSGVGANKKGAFGARHIWDKHKKDLSINSPKDLPLILSKILIVGSDILYENEKKPVVLNTNKGLVSLQLKKDSLGNVEYSIISAYSRKNSRGVVFAKLEGC